VAETSELERWTAHAAGGPLLDAVMAAIPACIVLISAPDAKVLRVSDYAARIFGFPRERFEGHSLRALVETVHPGDGHGRDLEADRLPIMRALRGDSVTAFDGELPTAHGARALTASNAAPVRNADGEIIGAISVLTDMTLFKTLIAELVARPDRTEGAEL
jgi:PAS domain-containing protein